MIPKDFPNGLELWREGKYFQTFDHKDAPWQAVPFYPHLEFGIEDTHSANENSIRIQRLENEK